MHALIINKPKISAKTICVLRIARNYKLCLARSQEAKTSRREAKEWECLSKSISPQAGEPFTINGIYPALQRTIPACKSQRFKVTTWRAAGLPPATAARPYFDIVIESGGSQSHLTTASLPQPEPLRLMGVRMHLQAGQLHLQTEGTGIESLQLQLFDLRGRKLIDHTSESRELTIPAETDTGQRLANGVYLYVVTVRGFDGSIIHSEVHKLVVLR